MSPSNQHLHCDDCTKQGVFVFMVNIYTYIWARIGTHEAVGVNVGMYGLIKKVYKQSELCI